MGKKYIRVLWVLFDCVNRLSHMYFSPLSESITRRADSDKPPALVAGGAEEARTPDLRLAKAALSQLSYGPVFWISR